MPRMFDKGRRLDPWMFDGTVWRRVMAGIYIMPNGCWYWKRHKDKNGYGQISVYIDGINSSMAVYRITFAIYKGPLLAGNVVDHDHCNFPPCCNPYHLEQISYIENCAKAGRNTQRKLKAKRDKQHEPPPF